MATILCIETSTTPCSAAIVRDGGVLFERADAEGRNHGKLLGVFVKQLLDELRAAGGRLDAVALSQGPGSYTGLRIGTSLAKGLCFGLDLPLLAVPTHLVMASEALKTGRIAEGDLLCPMIDARRMEVYSTLYDTALNTVRATSADIIGPDSYAGFLQQGVVWFMGDGAAKCKETLTAPNARFLDGIQPWAMGMADLAEKAWQSGKREDVAYFEPFYLKEFIATVPKNKVF
ncbi:MAG: tRNA (adenosine(37)-N6)-threonylcarbamoyltransferase complex dimerization subunit type 1 TsaB [Paludibacteraceae bacterium]|nr:tRNA (adenosine(37)-N6)-threonylcarbamoyltransferase complex dimerization subunit type 1 TsaB [Paludibacteraceae bacterium]